jgi:cytidylate kinase
MVPSTRTDRRRTEGILARQGCKAVAASLVLEAALASGRAAILSAMSDASAETAPGAPRGLVVALDGPASSGKSSVGAAAAKELGYRFCDTGLLYRAVTWLGLHRGIATTDTGALVGLVDEIELVDDGTGRLAHVAVDGVDQTAAVRGPDVDTAVSGYASVAELRLALLTRQRRLASAGRIIMAGRDIGTVVLNDADLKLYLDASVEERARRRVLERGIDPASDEAAEILAELRRRDNLDSTREVAPLRAAEDAVVIRTDGNELADTVRAVVEAIRSAEVRMAARTAEGAAAERAANADVADAAAEAPPPKRLRAPRAARRPSTPTPIATRNWWLTNLGATLLRGIVRSIVRFRVEGDLAALPKAGPMIMAANHASSADPVLIGAFLNKVLGRPLNWLGKRELVEFWLTGWAFRIAGIHPVDRDAADLEAFRTAMRILEAGQVLAVFPEGTRSRDGGLQQVREGVGMLALRSGAPVLPVAVIDSDILWPRGKLLPRFGKRVTVRYGTPFVVGDELAATGAPTKGRQATEAATRLVMARIAALLEPRQRGVYADDVRTEVNAPG